MPVMSARGAAITRPSRGPGGSSRSSAPGPSAQRRRRLEAHPARAPGSRRGSASAGRRAATRPRSISPAKPTSSRDRLGEVADARLDAGADVDRLGAVEVLGGEQQRAGGVVDVEELARRRARAPERRPVSSPRRGPRRTCGSSPRSRASPRGRSCRRARRGWRRSGRRSRSRTGAGRRRRARASSSSRARTARWTPPGSRPRVAPRVNGTGVNFG